MELTPSMPRDLWLDRFATRAGELIPAATPAEIWAHAEAVFPEAADLQPEEAAEIFALELPPDDPGAPGD